MGWAAESLVSGGRSVGMGLLAKAALRWEQSLGQVDDRYTTGLCKNTIDAHEEHRT